MSAQGRATFARRWQTAVAAIPDRPFLVWEGSDGTTVTWTYKEFDALVGRVAAGLVRRGVERGVAVHLALRNSPAFVAVWLAASRLGAWIVPSDPEASLRELVDHLGRTKPRVGLCGRDRAATYREAAADTVEVVEIEEDDTDLDVLGAGPAGRMSGAPPDPLDRAAVMFTSGTTSAPKGVVVTQANYAFAGDVMAAAAALSQRDRQLVVLPLFHANAQYYSFASAISAGASVALMSGFSASRFLAQASDYAATHASLFAAPMRMILARGAEPVGGLRLRHVWYAQNVSRAQYDELSGLFGCRPRQLYGMTETIPAVTTNRALSPIPESIGTPTLGCQVDVRDQETGRSVPPETVGEMVVGGTPGINIFLDYLDDPETTRASFRDGWFRTGDLAWRDHNNHFFFSGRRGDVLKVAGENVSTVEIEAVLAEHPAVLEAAVVGEADPVRDEVPVAYVVQSPGKPRLTTEDLNAHCAERLGPAKRPRAFYIVDELPRTSVGKIRKFLLGAPEVDGGEPK